MPAFVLIAEPPPIVVTGRPLPPPTPGLDAIVLKREDIDGEPEARLEQVLTKIPGVQTFRRADSGSAHPTASGLTARGLGGNAAGRMLVVMDGIPQNDPFGGWVDWPSLGIERIGEIRVERGGGQSRWGSGTIAGLVEIESLVPDHGNRFDASIEGGSRNGMLTSARASVADRRFSLLVGGSFRRSDGFIPIVREDRGPADIPAPFSQWEGGVRGATSIGHHLEVQAGWQSFDDRRERGLAESRNRTRGNDVSLRLVGSSSRPFQLSLFRQQRRFSSQFAATDDDRATSRPVLDQYRVPAVSTGARGEWDIVGSRQLTLRLGADARTSKGRTHEHYLYVGDAPTRDRSAGGRSATIGLFADAAGEVDRWRWTLSGRVDRWALRDGSVRERVIGGEALTDIAFPDRSGWQPSGRASIGVSGGPLRFEAAVHHAWRLPTLNELYRPYRVGKDAVGANAMLRPEVVDGAEISARVGGSKGWSGGLTLFANRLRDAIANVTLGEGPGVFPGVGFVAAGGSYARRLNVGSLDSLGAEVAARWSGGAWTISMAASLVDPRMRASGQARAIDGKRPANVPARTVSATARWNPSARTNVEATLRYQSRTFEDDANRETLEPALTMDLSASLPIARSLALIGAIENVSNARVETGLSGAATERATPRTAWLGFRISR